jgi:RNA polymerase sigma-70 factor (ECF subfamily)
VNRRGAARASVDEREVNELGAAVPGAPRSAVSDPDQEVLARILAGELDALEGLYERYRTMAYSIALRITTEPATAEDVVQEAFLGVWRNAGRYVQGRGSVKTWLLSIVHHRAIDSIRRRRSTSELPEGEGEVPEAFTAPDVWEDVAEGLDRASVQKALLSISAVQRECIDLAYFGGLTQVEIATRLGLPLGTVKSRLRLGLLGLRRALLDLESRP